MEWHSRGLDSTRARTNYDVSKFKTIEQALKSGDNPLNISVYSSAGCLTITALDLFNYYRFTGRKYDIVISGGK